MTPWWPSHVPGLTAHCILLSPDGLSPLRKVLGGLRDSPGEFHDVNVILSRPGPVITVTCICQMVLQLFNPFQSRRCGQNEDFDDFGRGKVDWSIWWHDSSPECGKNDISHDPGKTHWKGDVDWHANPGNFIHDPARVAAVCFVFDQCWRRDLCGTLSQA